MRAIPPCQVRGNNIVGSPKFNETNPIFCRTHRHISLRRILLRRLMTQSPFLKTKPFLQCRQWLRPRTVHVGVTPGHARTRAAHMTNGDRHDPTASALAMTTMRVFQRAPEGRGTPSTAHTVSLPRTRESRRSCIVRHFASVRAGMQVRHGFPLARE